MRNLKRVLSLALALVMVLGMMVITTSAADFTDADEITYTEAVDVISALGIINGFEAADGTFYFDAGETLTREQGAKIVCYLLMGKEDADQLIGSGEFTDVKATRWSAGAIDYCASKGILAGIGGGKFDPTGTLTIVQYAKMLLCALGYDAKIEGYLGTNWATAIVTDMIPAGLMVKDVDVDATLTREIAAQMTLQALEANPVTYPGGKGTDITLSDGTSITIGAGEAKPGEKALYETLTYATLTKPDVEAKNNGGLAGYAWQLEGAAAPIGVYTTESVKASYTSGTKFVDIVKALGVKNNGSKTYNVEVYRNGEKKTGVWAAVAGELAEFQADSYTGAQLTTAATNFGTVPNGCTVDIVVTDRGETIRMLVEISYLAVVNSKTAAHKDELPTNDQDDRYVDITANGIDYVLTAENCESFEEIYAAVSALKQNEALYYIVVPEGDPASQAEADAAEATLLSIEPATIVTGKMTSFTSTGTYTIGGEAYKASATSTVSANTLKALVGKDANYVLDAQGFIVAAAEVSEVEADDVYAYLRRFVKVSTAADGTIGSESSAYLQAELVFTDGTTEIVTVASYIVDENTEKEAADTNNTELAGYTGKFVAYEIDEDGLYELTAVDNTINTSGTVNNKVIFNGANVANAKTVFVVEYYDAVAKKNVYTAYTGYANLPADKYETATAIDGIVDEGVATFVYMVVELAAAEDDADGKTKVFVTGAPSFFYVDGKTKDYYEYPVIVDGEASTIKLAKTADALSAGLYVIETVNANGYVSATSELVLFESIATEAADTIVELTVGGWKTYDENTVVYVVDDGAVEVAGIEDLDAEYALYVAYVQKAAALGGGDSDMIAEIIAVPGEVEVTPVTPETIDAALAAAEDGDTIYLLAGEYDAAITTTKALTFLGAPGYETVLKGGLTVNATGDVTVKEIAFETKGLEINSSEKVTVENNTFKNVADEDAVAVNGAKDVTVSGNTIDGVISNGQKGGISVGSPSEKTTISGNTVKNVAHNAIIVHTYSDPVKGTIKITDNTLTTWGTGSENGRAIRVYFADGDATLTVSGNTMTHTNAPEEVVKVTTSPGAAVLSDAEGAAIVAGNTFNVHESDTLVWGYTPAE